MTWLDALGWALLIAGLLLIFRHSALSIFNAIKDTAKVLFELSARIHSHRAPEPPLPFDLDAARRQTHALGMPYPEPDGTLSLPPAPQPTPEQVHRQIHARRQAAEACPVCNGTGLVGVGYVLRKDGLLDTVTVKCKTCPAVVTYRPGGPVR